jgi:hypothetical protein
LASSGSRHKKRYAQCKGKHESQNARHFGPSRRTSYILPRRERRRADSQLVNNKVGSALSLHKCSSQREFKCCEMNSYISVHSKESCGRFYRTRFVGHSPSNERNYFIGLPLRRGDYLSSLRGCVCVAIHSLI